MRKDRARAPRSERPNSRGVIFPQGPVVTHQPNRLGAGGDFRKCVAIVPDAAEQREKFPPRVGASVVGEAGGSVFGWTAGDRSPRREGPPELVNVATAEPGLEQIKARFHLAVHHVGVIRIPANPDRWMIADVHDAPDVGRDLRFRPVYFEPDFDAEVAGCVPALSERPADLLEYLFVVGVRREAVGPDFHSHTAEVVGQLAKPPGLLDVLLDDGRVGRLVLAR